MKAARLERMPAAALALRTVPDPAPGPGEVLVEVEACGICGTDLHILDGTSYRPALPIVLGHETAGRVMAVGAGVDPGWRTAAVAVSPFRGCGACARCSTGDERLCAAGADVLGVTGPDGGFAEWMVAVAGQLVAIPPALSAVAAAATVDAGATAMNAVRRIREARDLDRERVIVIGAGPVGWFAARLLLPLAREVVCVERGVARRTAVAASGCRVAEDLAAVEGSADVVVEASGHPDALPWAVERLAARGTAVLAGYAPTALDTAAIARKELSVIGIRSGSRHDLREVLGLVATGAVTPPPIRTWPLAKINDAVAAIRGGLVPGKAVIVPASPDDGPR